MRQILRNVSALGVLAVVFCASCGGGRIPWRAAPIQGSGIMVTPTETYVQGHLLNVRTTFMNQGPLPITVNRDAVQLIMPDGRVVARSSGTYTQHTPYVIMPGMSHAVWVDFRAEGWRWQELPGAQVNWGPAVSVNGQPVAIGPMALAP